MKKILITLIFCNFLAFSQETKQGKHHIDVWLDSCLLTIDKNNTSQMVNLSNLAYDKWSKELDGLYNKLIEVLDSESKNILTENQKEWSQFKEGDINLVNNLKVKDEYHGLWVKPIFGKADIIKSRVLELQKYFDMIRLD
jgi:hypothetical protein